MDGSAGLAAAPKLETRVLAGLVPGADSVDGMHGTLCFWHKAQMALSGGIRWHFRRRDLAEVNWGHVVAKGAL